MSKASETGHVVGPGAPVVLATIEPTEGDSDWHASLRVETEEGAEDFVHAWARVRREGSGSRFMFVGCCSDVVPESEYETDGRHWFALVENELRLMAMTVGMPVRSHVLEFHAIALPVAMSPRPVARTLQ